MWKNVRKFRFKADTDKCFEDRFKFFLVHQKAVTEFPHDPHHAATLIDYKVL